MQGGSCAAGGRYPAGAPAEALLALQSVPWQTLERPCTWLACCVGDLEVVALHCTTAGPEVVQRLGEDGEVKESIRAQP